MYYFDWSFVDKNISGSIGNILFGNVDIIFLYFKAKKIHDIKLHIIKMEI